MVDKSKIKCEKCRSTIAYNIDGEIELKCRSCGHLNIIGINSSKKSCHLQAKT